MTRQMETREASGSRRLQRRRNGTFGGLCARNDKPAIAPDSTRRFRIDLPASTGTEDLPKPPMRVLLQNVKTMKFAGAGHRWTKDPKEARDFRNGWWATLHAFTGNPRHLVIQYEFDDDRYNLHIPVLGHSRPY
jgi:hypothetical protein